MIILSSPFKGLHGHFEFHPLKDCMVILNSLFEGLRGHFEFTL